MDGSRKDLPTFGTFVCLYYSVDAKLAGCSSIPEHAPAPLKLHVGRKNPLSRGVTLRWCPLSPRAETSLWVKCSLRVK